MRPPRPAATIVRATAWLVKNTPRKFTAIISSQSASETSKVARAKPRPALLTSTSMPPCAATMLETASVIEATSRTSSRWGCTIRPRDCASEARSAASASVRTVGTTTAPVPASRMVSSRPIPFNAPVMTTTRPLRSKPRTVVAALIGAPPSRAMGGFQSDKIRPQVSVICVSRRRRPVPYAS
jgi:hypothetical protein